MRSLFYLATISILMLGALSAEAAELTFTLDSYIGYGSATSLNPDPDSCLAPNCVLFTGTLTDNDVDTAPDLNPSYLFISIPRTGALDQTSFDGVLSLDNLAPTGLLSGDTNYLTDGFLNPANTYTGSIFGIDIPVGTLAGVYQDTVYLDIIPTNGNDPFTVSALVTVNVTPEPGAATLLFGGLAGLAAWRTVKRKWSSTEESR